MKVIRLFITIIILSSVVFGCGKKLNHIVGKELDFSVEKEEIITRNSMGGKVAEISFEIPKFENKVYEVITDNMISEKEKYFEAYEEFFLDYVSYGEDSDYREGSFPYHCMSKVVGVYKYENFVSVLTEFSWYAGGIGTVDMVGYNYFLESGEKVTIQEICDIDTFGLMKQIEKGLEEKGIEIDSYLEETLKTYETKEIPFYFDSTGIYVAFRTGVVGITADGCVVIPIE